MDRNSLFLSLEDLQLVEMLYREAVGLKAMQERANQLDQLYDIFVLFRADQLIENFP